MRYISINYHSTLRNINNVKLDYKCVRVYFFKDIYKIITSIITLFYKILFTYKPNLNNLKNK